MNYDEQDEQELWVGFALGWKCTCTGQGGSVYTSDCPVHDHLVNTTDNAWRRRYLDHRANQKRIAERLGW